MMMLAGLILALAAGSLLVPVFGQDNVITVNTDRERYEAGQSIIITGNVSAIIGENPVLLQIFNNDNTMVDVAQISLARDGSYSRIVIAEGNLWESSGVYVVRVSHGINNIAETTFEFVPADAETVITDNFEVDAGSSGTFDIGYTITGGTINDMVIIPRMLTLAITIHAENDGAITLDLPRAYIDARSNGCEGGDEIFIILIDQMNTPYEIVNVMSDSRTIMIKFLEGDSTIEVIGTCIIPEFNTAAILILIAVIAIVVPLARISSMAHAPHQA